MFHATRDLTARLVWVYSISRRFAIHRAETGLGIPRRSRTTRHSIGGSISAIARALSHALGIPGACAGPLFRGFIGHHNLPGTAPSGTRKAQARAGEGRSSDPPRAVAAVAPLTQRLAERECGRSPQARHTRPRLLTPRRSLDTNRRRPRAQAARPPGWRGSGRRSRAATP
jgi:hypothetical protein